MPSHHEQIKLLDLLIEGTAVIRGRLQEARETAAYAESLGTDIGREGDYAVHMRLMQLQGYLLAADILRWSMDINVLHTEETHEIAQQLRGEFGLDDISPLTR